MSVVAGWVCRALGAVKGPQATRFGFRQSKPFPRASYLRRTAVTSIPLSPTIIVAASVLNVRSYSTERMNSPPEKPEVVETGNLDFHDLINYASAHGPGFPVDASSVSVVREPSSFFDELAVRFQTFWYPVPAFCVCSFSNQHALSTGSHQHCEEEGYSIFTLFGSRA